MVQFCAIYHHFKGIKLELYLSLALHEFVSLLLYAFYTVIFASLTWRLLKIQDEKQKERLRAFGLLPLLPYRSDVILKFASRLFNRHHHQTSN